MHKNRNSSPHVLFKEKEIHIFIINVRNGHVASQFPPQEVISSDDIFLAIGRLLLFCSVYNHHKVSCIKMSYEKKKFNSSSALWQFNIFHMMSNMIKQIHKVMARHLANPIHTYYLHATVYVLKPAPLVVFPSLFSDTQKLYA